MAAGPEEFAKLIAACSKDGNELKIEDDTIYGLYFSAHWCPPCRGFTPQLVEYYNKKRSEGKKLEIIFVSSDKDQAAFDEYYGEMPWACLPFKNRDMKGKLATQFKVQGIPTLIFFNKKGEIITEDGRGCVASGKDI